MKRAGQLSGNFHDGTTANFLRCTNLRFHLIIIMICVLFDVAHTIETYCPIIPKSVASSLRHLTFMHALAS